MLSTPIFLHPYRLKGASIPDKGFPQFQVDLALANPVSVSTAQQYSQVIEHEVPADAEPPPAALLDHFAVQDSGEPVYSETPIHPVPSAQLLSSLPLLMPSSLVVDKLQIK